MGKLKPIEDKELARQIIENYVTKIQNEYYGLKDEDKRPGWPMELFGVECGRGWYGIVASLIKYIEEYNSSQPVDKHIVVNQVKEKYGELRFYTNFFNEELRELIDEAEGHSWNTCENCGATKNVGHIYKGWVSVMCADCLAELARQNKDRTYTWSDRDNVYDVNSENVDDFLKNFQK